MSGLPETTDASVFLGAVAERYKINKNAEVGTLMSKLTGMSYNSADGVRAYILGMIGVRDKLKSFKIPIPDSFIINHTLNSLPPKFSQLNVVFVFVQKTQTKIMKGTNLQYRQQLESRKQTRAQ